MDKNILTSIHSFVHKFLKNQYTYSFLIIFTMYSKTFGQDTLAIEPEEYNVELDLDGDNNYKKTLFRSTQIINVQTTEVLPVNGIEFNIKHRFGYIQPDRTIITQFLGFDLPTNIRFGFGIPISRRFYIGIGRTKYNKTYDLEGKYVLLNQTNQIPVAIAAYFNMAIMTDKFPVVGNNAFFSDGITPFKYSFSHRISYNTQLIIARMIGNKLSLQIAPTLIYKNLAVPGDDNYVVALPISGSLQTGLSSSLLFEFGYFFNNSPDNDIYPLSIGFEVGTAGHTFQIILSSSQHILEQEIYTNESRSYFKGNFLLGFNIKRIFHRKEKQK